jgi:hypothetical protein
MSQAQSFRMTDQLADQASDQETDLLSAREAEMPILEPEAPVADAETLAPRIDVPQPRLVGTPLQPIADANTQPSQIEAPEPPTQSQPRIVGAPLQMGASRRQPLPIGENGNGKLAPPPPGRALSGANDEPSSLQRAIQAVRSALPIVQRILPLLDGNLATTISNLMNPGSRQPAPVPKIDLAPIEDRVAELRTQHRGLRDQIMEQSTTIKRVEDQLEMVREATDRNTLEQQELLEDLKAFGNKVKVVAIVGLVLLGVGIAVNLMLFLRIQKLFP